MGGPNEMGPDLAGLDLSGVDLSGVDLSGVDQRLPDGCRDSAECPQQVAPICDRGSLPAMCRPCQRHEECRNRHPNLKWCIAGGCHECVSSNDCPNDLGCRAGACVACQVHGECASLVCDPYQRNGAGSHGRCVPQTSLIYVDNRNGGA
ncbi:MAG: hypothetical protein NZ890_07595, partial [Myxococcota bacterium]|nr:hypothetical protein [Myxococcota bacterium]